MTVQFYPNGIGGTAPGDSLDLARPLQTAGNIWYVSSLIGTDAGSPAGQNREKPLATVARAVLSALAGDTIVFLPGHTETLTATQAISATLTLIGEGTVSGKPAVSFIGNSVANDLFSIGAAGCELRNIYFPPNAQTNSSAKVDVLATDLLIKGCYFEQGATDTSTFGAVYIDAASSRFRCENTTFISVATLTSAQPRAAIMCSAKALSIVTLNNVVVSAGTVGFSNYSAIDLSAAVSMDIRAESLSLLLGADMKLPANATGRVNIQLATGGSRVQWS